LCELLTDLGAFLGRELGKIEEWVTITNPICDSELKADNGRIFDSESHLFTLNNVHIWGLFLYLGYRNGGE
jgi:hypothetical protein